MGWQVGAEGRDGYTGSENVAVTDETSQAAAYEELLRRAACDPDIAQVNVFGFRDDVLRTGFQAGLYRADGSERPSAVAIRTAMASDCAGAATRWRPTRAVVGAKAPRVRVAGGGIEVALTAAEGASARVCLLRGSHTLASARRLLASRRAVTSTCTRGVVQPRRATTLRLRRRTGSPDAGDQACVGGELLAGDDDRSRGPLIS
jgi:hypothetical protein